MASRPKRRLPTTRQSLLSRLKDWDDQASWRELFDTYWGVIYATARRAGLSDAESQDVVQDTVLHIAKELKEAKYDRKKGSFRNYLFQAVRWKIQGQVKSRKRHPASPIDRDEAETGTAPMERIADPAGNELQLIWEEEWVANLEAVAWERLKRKVRPRHFQIFETLVREEWEPVKVAQAFGISRATVYVIKLRLGRILAEEIKSLRSKPF